MESVIRDILAARDKEETRAGLSFRQTPGGSEGKSENGGGDGGMAGGGGGLGGGGSRLVVCGGAGRVRRAQIQPRAQGRGSELGVGGDQRLSPVLFIP